VDRATTKRFEGCKFNLCMAGSYVQNQTLTLVASFLNTQHWRDGHKLPGNTI